MRDFYDVLGVDSDASTDEIRQAFRERVRKTHPDVSDDADARLKLSVLTQAKEVLVNPERRATYDRMGHQGYVEHRLDADPADPAMGATPDELDLKSIASDIVFDADEALGPATGDRSDTEAGRSGDSASSDPSGTPGAVGSTSGQSSVPPGGGEQAEPTGDDLASGPSDDTTGRPEAWSPRLRDHRRADESTGSNVSWEKAQRRVQVERKRTRGHLTVSFNWVSLVLAAVLYGFGLGRYLRVSIGRFQDGFVASGQSGSISGLLAMLTGRMGAASPVTYVTDRGFAVFPDISFGLVLLTGSAFLPLVMWLAVRWLQRNTNWHPSPLHVVAAAGPLMGFAFAFVWTGIAAVVPSASMPLFVDLVFFVGFPTVAIFSYLINRFLLVAPLVRMNLDQEPDPQTID